MLAGGWAPSPSSRVGDTGGDTEVERATGLSSWWAGLQQSQPGAPPERQLGSRAARTSARALRFPACPPPQPPARCILRPSPTHLVSLEVIVQGELQLAQVLGLLLLLSLPLAFSQARFRIIVILAGTVGKRDLLPDEQSSPAVRGGARRWVWGARCCPGCAQPRRAPRSASGHAAPARPAQ